MVYSSTILYLVTDKQNEGPYFSSKDLEILDCPDNSPNMKHFPIQFFWNDMMNSISGIVCTTKAVLIERIIQFWHHNPCTEQFSKEYISRTPPRVPLLQPKRGAN